MRKMSDFTVLLVMTSPNGNRYEVESEVKARDERCAKAIAAETARLNNHEFKIIAKSALLKGFVRPEMAKAEK